MQHHIVPSEELEPELRIEAVKVPKRVSDQGIYWPDEVKTTRKKEHAPKLESISIESIQKVQWIQRGSILIHLNSEELPKAL